MRARRGGANETSIKLVCQYHQVTSAEWPIQSGSRMCECQLRIFWAIVEDLE